MSQYNRPTDRQSRLVAAGRATRATAPCPACGSRLHTASDCPIPEAPPMVFERASANGVYQGRLPVRRIAPEISGADLARGGDDASGLRVPGALVASIRSGSRYRVLAIYSRVVRLHPIDGPSAQHNIHVPLQKFTVKSFRRVR